MPNKLNQTLERLLSSGDRGLIANPFFERTYYANSLDTLTGDIFGSFPLGPPSVSDVATYGVERGLPSGWLRFGWVDPVTIQLSATRSGVLKDEAAAGGTSELYGEDNPIWAQNRWRSPGAGVVVVRDRIGGMATRLPNGPALRGKKIRIFGAYQTAFPDFGSPEVPLGVSIWLKGKHESSISRGDVSIDQAGGATGSQWASSFTFASGSAADWSAGDTVWIQSEDNIYQVASVVGSTINVEGILYDDYTTQNWSIGRATPGGVSEQANWHGGRGIHMTVTGAAGGRRPGLVVAVKDPTKTMNAGTEWFSQGIDDLVFPSDGSGLHALSNGTVAPLLGDTITGGGTPGDTLQSLGQSFLSTVPNTGAGTAPINPDTFVLIPGEGAFQVSQVVNDEQLRLAGPSYPTNGLTGLRYAVVSRPYVSDANVGGAVVLWGSGIDPNGDFGDFFPGAAPPALDGGAAPLADQSKIWFVDSETWSNDPLQGDMLLAEDLNTADGQVHYFDEVVEIPDNFFLDQEELYLVVLPTSPANFPNLHSVASVRYYGIQAEVIGQSDAAGDGAQDRIVRAAMNYASPNRLSPSAQNIWRDPLWVPRNYMVDLTQVVAATNDTSDITYMDPRITNAPDGNGIRIGDGSSRTIITDYFIPFPEMPLGTVLQNVTLYYTGNPGAGSADFEIVQGYSSPSPLLLVAPQPYNPVDRWSDTLTISTGTVGVGNLSWQMTGERPLPNQGVLYRHRLGFLWPNNDADLPAGSILNSSSEHTVVPARFYLRINPSGGASAWDLNLLSLRVSAWVDGRLLSQGVAFSKWGT
jgi:hypothetical protein